MSKPSAIVTGGAHRLGKGMALCLADLGYHIILHYGSSTDAARETRKEIEEIGVECQLISLDLSQADSGPALFNKINNEYKIEILVNSASIFQPSGFADESEESLIRHFNINFKSPYSLTKTFVNRYDHGHIINILDTKVSQNQTNHLDYLLTKKSLQDLTHLSAVACGPHFRVNGIAPGLILPPEGKDEDYLEKKATDIPLQTTGNLTQIQNALRYLVKNPFLTGQILFIDGGEHLL